MRATKSKTGTKSVRVRRSRAEVDRLVEDYARSGRTQESFARDRGISVGTLRGWLYRRGGGGGGVLREVLVRPQPSNRDGATVLVRTPRLEVDLPLCAGVAWIERMIRELARS